MGVSTKKACIVYARSLTLDEALEYLTAEGQRKEELERKLNRRKREF